MSLVNNVTSVLNAVVNQVGGGTAIANYSSVDVVRLGKHVFSSTDIADAFLGELVATIRKDWLSSKPYKADDLGIIVDTTEFGALIRSTYVEPFTAKQNPAYSLVNNSAYTGDLTCYKPGVKVHYIYGWNSWENVCTITDVAFRSAFDSVESMAAFINDIMVQLDNSAQLQIESLSYSAMNTLILNKLYKANGVANNADIVDVKTAYNVDTGATAPTSIQVALTNAAFLRWFAYRLKNDALKLSKMNNMFNNASYWRHCDADNLRLFIHNQVSSAMDFQMYADTWHMEMAKMPNYKAVPYWQGAGSTFDRGETMKVAVTGECYDYATEQSANKKVTQSGVFALMCEPEAIAITMKENRKRTSIAVDGEFTNHFDKYDFGVCVDPSRSAILYVWDAPAAPTNP